MSIQLHRVKNCLLIKRVAWIRDSGHDFHAGDDLLVLILFLLCPRGTHLMRGCDERRRPPFQRAGSSLESRYTIHHCVFFLLGRRRVNNVTMVVFYCDPVHFRVVVANPFTTRRPWSVPPRLVITAPYRLRPLRRGHRGRRAEREGRAEREAQLNSSGSALTMVGWLPAVFITSRIKRRY